MIMTIIKTFTITMVSSILPNVSIECTLEKVAAAVYCITDMVVFQVYKTISDDKYYLVVILQQDDINEHVNVFEWEDVPQDIMDIYSYVSSTSVMEQKDDTYILYGNHIGRNKDHKYVLMQYITNPCMDEKLHILSLHENVDENVMKCYTDICENMKIVKKLV